MTRALRNVERLLGGRVAIGGPVRTDLDLAEAIERGFPYRVVVHVTSGAGSWLSARELYNFIPRRTLEHRMKLSRLTSEQSDRLARVARITALAEEIFGSTAKARTWLRRKTRPLGGKAPFDLLGSDAGAAAVDDLLGRIEHGIAA